MAKVPKFKEYIEKFNSEKIYTKADMTKALAEQEKVMVVNRVIQKGKDFDIALQILAIHKTPDGIIVIVK